MKRRNRIKPDNLVANNPKHDRNSISPADKKQETLAKRDTLYDALNPFQWKILEIYGSKSEYRKTASGRWREVDEPDEYSQLKQADAIRKKLQAKMTAQSRERLKRANKVPVRKDGRKVFEEFCEQAYKSRRQEKTIDDADLRNIFYAAQHLSYEKWIWFVNDEYSSRI
jgi:hypothetical protein